MVITRYHVLIGLVMLFLLFAFIVPQENTYNDPSIDIDQSTDNYTDSNQSVDQNPLMSSIDTAVDDKKGWWKHEGHSTVTGGNLSASGVTSSTGSGIIDENEGDGTGEENDGNGDEDEGDGTGEENDGNGDEDEGDGTGEENDGNGDEDEGDGTGNENEIPEFPNVTIPMVAVLVLVLSFRKK